VVVAVVLQDPLHLRIEMVHLVLPTKDMVVEMVIMDHQQPLVLVVAEVVLVAKVEMLIQLQHLVMVVLD
tara:strand:- start:301 stop:507 length:207 start_codon:yes stop_codon:yes gene_type:complete